MSVNETSMEHAADMLLNQRTAEVRAFLYVEQYFTGEAKDGWLTQFATLLCRFNGYTDKVIDGLEKGIVNLITLGEAEITIHGDKLYVELSRKARKEMN